MNTLLVNLPDNIKNNIFSFLSTPTSDIIRRDVIRQFECFKPLGINVEEWKDYYHKAYFAEQSFDSIIRLMFRVAPFTLSSASKWRYVKDKLILENIIDDISSDCSDMQSDDE